MSGRDIEWAVTWGQVLGAWGLALAAFLMTWRQGRRTTAVGLLVPAWLILYLATMLDFFAWLQAVSGAG